MAMSSRRGSRQVIAVLAVLAVIVLFAVMRLRTNSTARKSQDELIIFVSECHHFNDWQSITQFYSSHYFGNAPGMPRSRAIRLNNCNCDLNHIFHGDKKTIARYSRERVTETVGMEHVTPCHLTDPGTNEVYFPGTKPFSVHHFFKNDPPVEETVVLSDPDFIVLRPFGERVPRDTIVAHYYPFGTKFGSDPILAPAICPKCAKMSAKDLQLYQVGPPYIMHRDTWLKFTPLWYELTQQIRSNSTLKKRSGFYTDMVTFSMALIILDIKVDRREDLMVSLDTERVFNEQFDDSKARFRTLPFTLHYCQAYDLGDDQHKFHKHELHDDDFTTCSGGLQKAQQKLPRGCMGEPSIEEAKSKGWNLRKSWMCHTVVDTIWQALSWYHEITCSGKDATA